MFDRGAEPERGTKWEKKDLIFSFSLTVAAPDLLDPKSATHNTKPRLSFSTKPITLTPQEESEVSARSWHIYLVSRGVIGGSSQMVLLHTGV